MYAKSLPDQIEFNRPMKYKTIKRLGSGACGETVQIRDEEMGIDLVAKKYNPIFDKSEDQTLHAELLDRFRAEARILFQLNHPNIVRVFNYYDYKEIDTSYIIMECISGKNILEYIKDHPLDTDNIFEKVISGFMHLEQSGILHRDIRPDNILVDTNGNPKIIDFGFGKELAGGSLSFEKSVSLNWWCETPPEFEDKIYDEQSEVYFVGQLFEQSVKRAGISEFKYTPLLQNMSVRDRSERAKSFSEIQKAMAERKFNEFKFSDNEIQIYRNFANSLTDLISSIEGTASEYENNNSKILEDLSSVVRKNQLNENIYNAHKIAQAFLRTSFRFSTREIFPFEKLQNFVQLLESSTTEKRSLIIENLWNRIDEIPRTWEELDDDDIPF